MPATNINSYDVVIVGGEADSRYGNCNPPLPTTPPLCRVLKSP